ncbi:hypothetical protein A2U01_0097608, partial [Trifolium medium]|nr:hypothetical protein [Trifolium medium]
IARALRAYQEKEGVASGICASGRCTGALRRSAADALESLC